MRKSYILIVLITYFLMISTESSALQAPEGMVQIPGGCFMMGTDKVYDYEEGRKNDRERPAHKVCLDSFFMDKLEASQKKFQEVMGYNPSVLTGEDWPVDRMKYREARVYCAKQGKRLPTEAEWEYAARAGSKAENFWGDGVDGDYLWFVSNSNRTPHPVGTRKPNSFGLHDMMGSVWEWVSDWYSDHYYKKSPVKNPKGPKKRQSWHVIRGGSWVDEEHFFRAAIRYRGMTDPTETFLLGARCARDLKPKK